MRRVVVTGSRGFIGQRVFRKLQAAGYEPLECDVDFSPVRDGWISHADAAIHLAADKYAINGELNPSATVHANVTTTQTVVKRVPRVVLASTCKAASPITCYGASKLIAERLVLNAGGTVVRLVNVLGSSGSVTELWHNVPAGDPLPVTDCERMFMSPDDAASLLVHALELPPGRYGPLKTWARSMDHLAAELYPGRRTVRVPLRLGDRPVERLTNDYETTVPIDRQTVEILDAWQAATRSEEYVDRDLSRWAA